MSFLSGADKAAAVYLTRWLATRSAEPPVLLVGPDKTGLHAAALELARAGLCQNDGFPCQACPACRQVEKQIHPDFNLISEEDDVSIEAWRALLKKISRRSPTGRRLVVIEAVERLSMPAINALLKTLEEPPAQVRLVLTTQYAGRLPATLRSRCHAVRMASNVAQFAHPAGGEGAIQQMAKEMGELLKTDGPSPALRRAFLRLRDYYRIKSVKGNTKLAQDVLRYSYEPRQRL